MDELTRVTTELETARDELLASKATKDSLVGEVQSLQQDLEGEALFVRKQLNYL